MIMSGTTRLRAACDACHRLKVRCSGSLPCEGCAESERACFYSASSRLGRPPGMRNKNVLAQQPDQQMAPVEFIFSSKSTSPPSKKPPLKPQSEKLMLNTASGEKTARLWNHWSQNTSPISGSKRHQKSQTQPQSPMQLETSSHVQSHTQSEIQSQAQPQTDVSLLPWPPVTQQSPQLHGAAIQSVGSDDLGLRSYIPGSNHSVSWVDDTASHDYTVPTAAGWCPQTTFGLSDEVSSRDLNQLDLRVIEKEKLSGLKDLLDYRRSILDDSPQASDPELALPTPTSSVNPSTPRDHSWNDLSRLDCAPADSLFENPPPETSQDRSEHCGCLQTQTELLCALKTSDATRGARRPTVDLALHHIQDALRVWRDLIKCPNCAHNDDQEVLILALMSIRSLLTQLRQASWRDNAANLSDLSSASKIQSHNRKSRDSSSKFLVSIPEFHVINNNNDLQIQIGDFEVTGHDKIFLLQALRSNLLRKVATVLVLLREILERKKNLEKDSSSSFLPTAIQGHLGGGQWQEPRHGTSSAVVEQMMQDTMSAVESLMGGLRPRDM